MGTFLVGTLSTKNGWERESVEEALSLHFAYWFASRRNQGKVIGEVPSFYYLWQMYGTNPELMVENTKEQLTNYVKELFPTCSVGVDRTSFDTQTNNYRLIITVRVVVDSVAYDMARAILVSGSFYKVLDNYRLGDGQ